MPYVVERLQAGAELSTSPVGEPVLLVRNVQARKGACLVNVICEKEEVADLALDFAGLDIERAVARIANGVGRDAINRVEVIHLVRHVAAPRFLAPSPAPCPRT